MTFAGVWEGMFICLAFRQVFTYLHGQENAVQEIGSLSIEAGLVLALIASLFSDTRYM